MLKKLPENAILIQESEPDFFKQETILLFPQGELWKTFWFYDETTEQGAYYKKEITENLEYYLTAPFTLTPGCSLRSFFLIAQKAQVHISSIINNWMEEFIEEALAPLTEEQLAAMKEDEDPLQYLELYWAASVSDAMLYGLLRPSIHGYGASKNNEPPIAYSLSFVPVNQIIDLPIRFASKMSIDDVDIPGLSSSTIYLPSPATSLLQCLDGIFWELSFWGNPAQRKEEHLGLQEAIKELEEKQSEDHV